ncbi:hypothetical protein DPMN_029070 [Dreissena polymorpha]|uniref:Uncharacterized protein n=1 Tax=Dreissena polymorpha TaxID=45954 RepID=A0A9D4LYC3_DREPO|nr:hypothetical protein DPMN_029070 [Dreissena polymorpha]
MLKVHIEALAWVVIVLNVKELHSIGLEIATEGIVYGKEIELRCSGVQSFVFEFTGTSSKNASIKIGGCSSFNHCYSTKPNFNVTHMEDGGKLIILNYEYEDQGTYTCIDWFDPKQRASVEVAPKSGYTSASEYNIFLFFSVLIVEIFII